MFASKVQLRNIGLTQYNIIRCGAAIYGQVGSQGLTREQCKTSVCLSISVRDI